MLAKSIFKRRPETYNRTSAELKDYVKELFKIKKLTYEQISQRTGIPESTIASWQEKKVKRQDHFREIINDIPTDIVIQQQITEYVERKIKDLGQEFIQQCNREPMFSQIGDELIFCRLMEQIYPKPPKRPKKGEPKPELNRNPEIEKIIKRIVKNFRIIMKKKQDQALNNLIEQGNKPGKTKLKKIAIEVFLKESRKSCKNHFLMIQQRNNDNENSQNQSMEQGNWFNLDSLPDINQEQDW